MRSRRQRKEQETPETKETVSLKEAVALYAAWRNCSGQSCSSCPMVCPNCEGGRQKITQGLLSVLKFPDDFDQEILNGKFSKDNKIDPAVKAYEAVMALDIPDFGKQDDKPDEPEQKESDPRGTCTTCLMSQMHPSGILWCKSFGNFVHGDGFCYRYKSDKIEM